MPRQTPELQRPREEMLGFEHPFLGVPRGRSSPGGRGPQRTARCPHIRAGNATWRERGSNPRSQNHFAPPCFPARQRLAVRSQKAPGTSGRGLAGPEVALPGPVCCSHRPGGRGAGAGEGGRGPRSGAKRALRGSTRPRQLCMPSAGAGTACVGLGGGGVRGPGVGPKGRGGGCGGGHA